jgi:hypothetical protein
VVANHSPRPVLHSEVLVVVVVVRDHLHRWGPSHIGAHDGSASGIKEADLWEESKGFILHLDHEYGYVLDPEQREALVPAISRYERDRFLDACYSLFGPLDHFVRTTAWKKRL